jgi:hypothetical protein
MLVRHEQDVIGIYSAYGLGAFIVLYVKTAGPTTVCYTDPLSNVNISLFRTNGINLSPSRPDAIGFSIVAGQDDARTQLATFEFHIFD